jgi:hypothetical protein
MTRDEIIERMNWLPSLAKETDSLIGKIERIVRAAEQAEREACAKVCDDIGGADAWDCAAAIRARKPK